MYCIMGYLKVYDRTFTKGTRSKVIIYSFSSNSLFSRSGEVWTENQYIFIPSKYIQNLCVRLKKEDEVSNWMYTLTMTNISGSNVYKIILFLSDWGNQCGCMSEGENVGNEHCQLNGRYTSEYFSKHIQSPLQYHPALKSQSLPD